MTSVVDVATRRPPFRTVANGATVVAPIFGADRRDLSGFAMVRTPASQH
jgi:hypothetical protein